MLTLLDQQPRDSTRAAAAQTALTRRTGQPGALDASTADRWASPTATLYNDLNSSPSIPGRPTLLALPFRYRCRACSPAEHLFALDIPRPSKEL